MIKSELKISKNQQYLAFFNLKFLFKGKFENDEEKSFIKKQAKAFQAKNKLESKIEKMLPIKSKLKIRPNNKNVCQSMHKQEPMQTFRSDFNSAKNSNDLHEGRAAQFSLNSNLDDIFNKTSDEDEDLERLMSGYLVNGLVARNSRENEKNSNTNNTTINNQNLMESIMLDDLSKNFGSALNQNNHLLIKDDDDDEDNNTNHLRHSNVDKHEEYDIDYNENESSEEEEDEEEDYDEQTHITTLHEFA